ncbi:hypothetical protein [Enterobacter hormaechei]|uniref:hypothetical protein n=1 Tax=Enterobacter hormaechei TaxID=158836 RepID=UPI0011132584|nr:hypothetical protein [Enterobacter hormaechei]
MSILIVSWGQNTNFSFAFHISSGRNFCGCADAVLTGDRVTEFKAIADKNVFPCVKCEVSFPHSAIRITTAQNACVIVVSAKEMEIHKACMTSLLDVPVFFVADVPKPTFYRLPCGNHADNFT